MAAPTFFVISPSTLVSVLGLLRGPRPTPPLTDANWRDHVKVRVVIPAHNEAATIALCLASLLKQSLQPHDVLLIDDGSRDGTSDVAHAFCEANGITLRIVRRGQAIGKTAGVRREAADSGVDVEFVLDGDTILESPDYIERCVEELYRVPGLASACGLVMPLRHQDIEHAQRGAEIKAMQAQFPQLMPPKRNWFKRFLHGVTNLYRESLYYFIQNVIYRGEQNLFGSINNPVGCAVAYRREYLNATIDQLAKKYGDNLTTSEDIFFGLSFVYRGYRNVQVFDVLCRSQEPPINRVPQQLLMWSSSWLQSLWYLPKLLLSPFLALKRHAQRQEQKHSQVANLRKVQDPYRWPWGENYSNNFGRPIGWSIFMAILEKIAFPIALIVLIALQWWEVLAFTIACELGIYILLVWAFGPFDRPRYIIKGILAAPIRYFSILFDIVTITRFAFDGITGKQRHWRK